MQKNTSEYIKNFGKAYANSLPTLGDTLVQVLSFFGVKRIYGVGGDFAANLIRALETNFDIVASGNELHAAYSACAQAELTGIGVCLTTYNVGSLPCVSALALAKAECLPFVLISGAPGESEINELALHHTVISSSQWRPNFNSAMNAIQGLDVRVERLQGERHSGQPNIAGEVFFRLIQHAYLNHEPVFIEIPRDIIFEKTQTIDLSAVKKDKSVAEFVYRGADQISAHIVDKFTNAKTPLIYIGERIKLNRSLIQSIITFCNKYKISYVTSWLAKGIVSEYDPLCLGTYNGVFSDKNVRNYIENRVDYILEIGTSICDQDTGTAFGTSSHYIKAFENKTVLKGTLPNDHDITLIISMLLKSPVSKKSNYYLSNKVENPEFVCKKDLLGFYNICTVLNELQCESFNTYIYLPEMGNSFFTSFSLQLKASKLGRSWLSNPWYAAMGTSLPYARAVCHEIKQQNLSDLSIVLTGDGGFGFQSNELAQFQRDNLHLLIIYMRNNIFHLGKMGNSPIYHCIDPEFDPKVLITAYGGVGERCETVGQLISAIKHWESQPNLCLLEVPCSIEEDFLSDELQLMNLFIKTKNGNAEALKKWNELF